MATVFKKFSHEERAFINPEDVTKRNPDFPELCVSTFSENIINKFTSLKSVKVIGELYTANGTIPIYEILYKNTRIAFFLSRVGAPACVAGIEEVIALGAKKLVLFGSCGILNEEAANGKIIVPTAAFRDVGTSYHYIEAADEILADKKSVDTLTRCLKSGNKTRLKIRADTILRNFPLYCPKCRQETLINVCKFNISVIKEPDAKTQSR